jgi:hypothetical protein
MPSLRGHRLVAVAALATALSLATAASGALIPHVDHPRIVPNESIAGVKLDMTRHEVFARWGPGACGPYPRQAPPSQFFCRWGPRDRYKGETVLVAFRNGEVDSISISARLRRSDSRIIPGEVARRWRTREGIHLGSPISDVTTAYSAVKQNPGGLPFWDWHAGAKADARTTRFTTGLSASKNRVVGISVSWDVCHHGGGC